MTIPAREDKLQELRTAYVAQMRMVVDGLAAGNLPDSQNVCASFHQAGVNYFNEFERTLDEYGLPEYEISQDIITRKGEDAINFVDTIIGHWRVLRKFCVKYSLHTPEPSTTAYASLQRVIKKSFPGQTRAYEEKFRQEMLPVHGFTTNAKHSGFKMKTKIAIPTIVGAVCLIIGTILAFVFNHPNGIQYLFIRGFYVLGIVGVAVGILVGTVKLQWSMTKSILISATGGFALLIIIYYWNPPPPPSPGPNPVQNTDKTNLPVHP